MFDLQSYEDLKSVFASKNLIPNQSWEIIITNLFSELPIVESRILCSFDPKTFYSIPQSEVTQANNLNTENIKNLIKEFDITLQLLSQLNSTFAQNGYTGSDKLLELIKYLNSTNTTQSKVIPNNFVAALQTLSDKNKDFLSSLVVSIFVYQDFDFLYQKIVDYHNLILKLLEEDGFISKLINAWILYRAYTLMPKEVFSYVDDISISGLITEKNKIEQSISSTQNSIEEKFFDDIVDQFKSTEESVGKEAFQNTLVTLTKLNNVQIESLYNLSQLSKLIDEEFEEDTVNFSYGNKLIEIPVSAVTDDIFDDVSDIFADIDEAFSGGIPVEDFEIIMEDIINVIDNLPIESQSNYQHYFDLEVILLRILRSLKEIIVDKKIDLFIRKSNPSVFDTFLHLADEIPWVNEAFSGNFDELIQNGNFSSNTLISGLTEFSNIKLNALNKLLDDSYLANVLAKRIAYYSDIILLKYQGKPIDSDHQQYLLNTVELCKSLKIDTLIPEINQINALKESSNYIQMIPILNKLGNLILGITEDEELSNQYKSIDIASLIGNLGGLGLEFKIEATDPNKIVLRFDINQEIFLNYFKGYYDMSAVNGDYAISNLFAFAGIITADTSA